MGFEPRRASMSNAKRHRCINCLGNLKYLGAARGEGTEAGNGKRWGWRKKMKEREKSWYLTGKFRLNFEGNRENLEYLRTLLSAIDFFFPFSYKLLEEAPTVGSSSGHLACVTVPWLARMGNIRYPFYWGLSLSLLWAHWSHKWVITGSRDTSSEPNAFGHKGDLSG